MDIAIWIIAACEVVRMAQNAIQIGLYKREVPDRENAYKEFVRSLKDTDKAFIEAIYEHMKKLEGDEGDEDNQQNS